jgi:cobalt/nickel transport system permease protein
LSSRGGQDIANTRRLGRRSQAEFTFMHLPDGFLNASTCAGTGALAGGAVAWAARQARATVGDRLIPLMGVMSACIFAAQMVNFPIWGGTSGHLLGGVLAAVVLGPWAGVLAMSVVLVVQCLLFYDGGLTALGANIVNMALAGSLAGYAVYATIVRLRPTAAAHVAGAVIASWLSVQLAAALCALELWWSGTYPLGAVLPAMLIVHSFIGVGEALITGAVVAFLIRVRPEMLYAARTPESTALRLRQVAVAGLATALFVAFFVSPLASAAPDGLEAIADSLGTHEAPPAPAIIPMADYQVAWLRGAWLATSLAGAIGALTVFGLAWVLSRGVRYGTAPLR